MSSPQVPTLTRTPLPRRTFLQGMGTVLGVPWLEAMTSTRAMAAPAASQIPKRMAFVFFANGAIMPDWKPTGEGKNYELSKTLKSLAPVKDDCLVISGLTHDKARANGDGGGDHARNSGSFLTASQPRKTGGADIQVGRSVDQVAAEKIGHLTHLPSFEIGIDPNKQAGVCDSGYSCAYQSNISWKTPSQPVAKEINPKLAFERLFGMSAQDVKQRQERDFYRTSILDLVAEDASRLQQKLGQFDRRKMDEYFSSVRDIEQRIGRASNERRKLPDDFKVPPGLPPELTEHIRLMYEILALAFQTDSTRVATYMLANGGSNRRYENLEIKGGHHQLSHHRNEADKVAEIQKIDAYLAAEFSRFIQKLKATPEGEGTLLDHSMILFGSGISDANRHQHDDLPIVLAGRGGGSIQTGRHLVVDKETPMANLFLSMLDRMDTPIDQFGDSTGRLEQLG